MDGELSRGRFLRRWAEGPSWRRSAWPCPRPPWQTTIRIGPTCGWSPPASGSPSPGTRRGSRPSGARGHTKALATKLKEQEQKHYDLLAPVLGDTAPVDDDFEFTLPKGATASPKAAVDFSLTLERLLTGIGITAAGTTTNPGLSQALARVATADSVHVGALTGLNGSVLGPVAAEADRRRDGVDELAKYLH